MFEPYQQEDMPVIRYRFRPVAGADPGPFQPTGVDWVDVYNTDPTSALQVLFLTGVRVDEMQLVSGEPAGDDAVSGTIRPKYRTEGVQDAQEGPRPMHNGLGGRAPPTSSEMRHRGQKARTLAGVFYARAEQHAADVAEQVTYLIVGPKLCLFTEDLEEAEHEFEDAGVPACLYELDGLTVRKERSQ